MNDLTRNVLQTIPCLIVLTIAGCSSSQSTSTIPAANDEPDVASGNCDEQVAAFGQFLGTGATSCDGDYVSVSAPTGLQDVDAEDLRDRMMVGITAWINRVPVPYDYQWSIPVQPLWQHPYAEASSRGPIAIAANGVPIFHLDPRPDVSTDPGLYDPRFDTVLHGELDQCGGHAGQGEDYHYHYAPVCLLDEHDLSLPIGFGLDGAPLFYGTGGTDYFGSGRYNDIDNLPAQSLDECNAVQLDDGSYAHYTTTDAPYTIGCHHAYADAGLRIEPSPIPGREQGVPDPVGLGYYGEPMQTLVTDFYVDDDGTYHLEHDPGTGVRAVIYRRSSTTGDCWEFEYRDDVNGPGIVVGYCR